jgi:proline iminopeptidase
MIKDGFIPFGPYRTYYRIVGKPSDKAPLLLLHGGPGSTHNYFEALDELAERDQRQLIMYDQIGCGLSSMPDHPRVYQAATWLRELKNLRERLHLDQIHLLGQSWGGMLAIMYLCDEIPAGIKSLILSSTLSDAQLWGQEQHRLISFMSNVGELAYQTAWGPNEFTPTGNLKDYDYTNKLRNLYVPTLITSGTNDLCTPLVAKTMADALPNSQWHLFNGTRHMSFVEKPLEYQAVLQDWLDQHD